MASITCNYDGKEGYSEDFIYGGIPHTDLEDRDALVNVDTLRARAKLLQWGEEPVRYDVEG